MEVVLKIKAEQKPCFIQITCLGNISLGHLKTPF